jgi:hypothetical protein
MKNSLLSAYLWCYDKPEAADVSFKKFREFYKDGEIHCTVDLGGKVDDIKKVCDKWNAEMKVNPINVGRCGWMGHYEKYEEDGPRNELNRKCWPKENAFIWMDRLCEVAKNCGSKYLISLEDDTFILKPISILNSDFGIAVFEYNTNSLPHSLLNFINKIGGNTNIPVNIFGNKGYGAGGGFIIHCDNFVKSWESFRIILDSYWEELVNETHLIGWVDVLPQITMMAGGYDVVMNKNLVQIWFGDRKDLYPNFGNWKDYEIVDFIKDMQIIKNL